ncbi:hypothetical protein NECID01_0544 [Nematocida sp. AWRm77]|nr:hypothetical protein NECID01_0544 [Nematocida sp. AWRm77]
MLMAKIVENSLLLVWTCAVLVCSTYIDIFDFELIDEIEMMYASINPDNVCSSQSSILNSLPRDNLQNVMQEKQTLDESCSLDVTVPLKTLDSVGINEDSSASASLSLPSTRTSTSSNSGTSSSISSVQVQPPTDSSKRACDTEEKKDSEQKAGKKQKTNTTITIAEANNSLMDEAEADLVVMKFVRCFRDDKKIWIRTPSGMVGFAEDLAQRALTGVHSSKIVDLCTAPEQWLGHDVFWRMLLFFVDTLSLEVSVLNRLENKKTVVLRNRKPREKPLSEYKIDHIYKAIAKYQGAERMEIQCNLSFLEGNGTEDVFSVLRWLLYHVNIQFVGISCNLTEASMNSAVLGRQVESLSKERGEKRVCIDSLTLYFTLAQHIEAVKIVKECPSIPVLKISFIPPNQWHADDRKQLLVALLAHSPALEQLSVLGIHTSIDHIRTIAAMLPQLVLLEVELLSLEEEEESMLVFPDLQTLKLLNIYTHPDVGIKNLISLFPNLKHMEIAASDVTINWIYALSTLRYLRSLEVINGSLTTETAECLLDKLPALECLSVGVNRLNNAFSQSLSRCTSMHTLKLRGYYAPGFLASLLRPSSLMRTLKVLDIHRYHKNETNRLSAEDKFSMKIAKKNFRCAVTIRYKGHSTVWC